MAKVIEFYLRGPVPKKVKPVPIEQRGKLVEFPKEQFAAQSKTEDITERGEVSPSTSFSLDVFKGINERGYGNAIRSSQDICSYAARSAFVAAPISSAGQRYTAPTLSKPTSGPE